MLNELFYNKAVRSYLANVHIVKKRLGHLMQVVGFDIR